MKVFNSTLAAIGLAAFVFASCSDNTSDSTGDSSPAKVDATTLDLTNSGESLLSSVINYKNTTANARKFFGTRAASDANFVTDLNKDEESTIPVQPATATQALGNDNLVNGVAVDSKYIYVACGGYGLVVLDKTKAKGENVVARRRAFYDGKESYNSANYVTLYNGYICVAYGRSRVQIFKLVNTK